MQVYSCQLIDTTPHSLQYTCGYGLKPTLTVHSEMGVLVIEYFGCLDSIGEGLINGMTIQDFYNKYRTD